MRHKSSAGFTLIEVVTVLGLIAVLALVALPNFIEVRDDARSAVTRDEMAMIKRAIIGDARVSAGGVYTSPGFEADLHRLPANLGELVTQGGMATYDPVNRIGWRGPYVDTSAVSDYTRDAWGTLYNYNTGARRLRSFGPNAVDNTGGVDDIDVLF